MRAPLSFEYDDGGRLAAGFSATAPGDCVARSIAIATRQPYRDVYDALTKRAAAAGFARSARNGIPRAVYEPYLFDLGWWWVATMHVGEGCTVHVTAGELPDARALILRLSRHLTAIVDGVIRDVLDPSRDGRRCVYGYFEGPTS